MLHTSIVFPLPGGPNNNSPLAGVLSPTKSYIRIILIAGQRALNEHLVL